MILEVNTCCDLSENKYHKLCMSLMAAWLVKFSETKNGSNCSVRRLMSGLSLSTKRQFFLAYSMVILTLLESGPSMETMRALVADESAVTISSFGCMKFYSLCEMLAAILQVLLNFNYD